MTPERTRELLENCAKACGYNLEWHFNKRTKRDDPYIGTANSITPWNPCTNSADEAEMEAKLRLNVEWNDATKLVCVWKYGRPYGAEQCYEYYADHPTPQAARRHAGCRAAEAYFLQSSK